MIKTENVFQEQSKIQRRTNQLPNLVVIKGADDEGQKNFVFMTGNFN